MIINLDFIIILSFIISTILLNPLLGASAVQYVDEFLLIFAIVRIFFQFNRLKKNDINYAFYKKTLIIIILITIVGFTSNFISRITSFKSSIIDWIGILKAPIVFVYISSMVTGRIKKKINNKLYIMALFFIPIAFTLGVVNLFVNIGMTYDFRFGIRSYEFIYRNPAALSEVIFCLLATIYKRNNKYWPLYSFLAMFTVLFTLRGASFGLLAIFLYLSIILKNKTKMRIKISHILFIIILAFVVGKNQINHYFFNESPRSILLNKSFVVANRYFPLGAGFASYGSDQAYKNYSTLYKEFGFNNIYWLSEEAGYAANDNFWPMIIGQLGYIGVILYIILLIMQFKYIFQNDVNKEEKLIQLVLFMLLLISSLGNAIFTSASGMMVFTFIGLLMVNKEEVCD